MEIKKDNFELKLIKDIFFASLEFKALEEVVKVLGELKENQIPLNVIVKDFTFSPENKQKLAFVVKGEHREKLFSFFKEKKWNTSQLNQLNLLSLEAPALRKFSGIIYDVVMELEEMEIDYHLCSNSEIKIMFVLDKSFQEKELEELKKRLKKKWQE